MLRFDPGPFDFRMHTHKCDHSIANALDVSADTLLIDVVAHSVTGVTNELTEKIEKLPIKEQKNFIGMLYYQIDIGMW